MKLEIKTYQNERIFYEAIWFSYDNLDEPTMRGYDVNKIIDNLLNMTKDQSGCVEVYKFACNKFGHKIQLYAKFEVFNELDLLIE